MKALIHSNDIEPALNAAISAALEEQKSGEFISLEAVTHWLSSWGTPNEVSPPSADIFKTFN